MLSSKKIHTIIAGSVAVAALSIPGAASAAMLMRSPATVTQAPEVQAPSTLAAREAGSAGVPGWDDARCEGALADVELLHTRFDEAEVEGNQEDVAKYANLSKSANQTLTDNCLVVD